MTRLEEFRTSLQFEVSRIDDPGLLYRTYYTITTPKIETSVKDLFASRKLSTETADFSFFMNEILPLNQYTVEENTKFLSRMTDGKLIDKDYLSKADGKVQNLRELVDPEVPTPVLEKLINHTADSMSSSSVGKGEFAFVLLTGEASKPKKGGDLRIGDTDVEIKSKGAKLASQSSHISLMAIKGAVQEYLGDLEIKPLSPKNLREHYIPFFGSWDETKKFLEFVFRKTMFRETDFEWISGCSDINEFFEELAIKEFTYYRFCDKFDSILFVNPDNLNVYSTSEMDRIQLEHFSLTRSFSFASERIQTNYYTLR